MNYDDFQLGNFTLYKFGSPKPNFEKISRSTAVPDMTPEPKVHRVLWCATQPKNSLWGLAQIFLLLALLAGGCSAAKRKKVLKIFQTSFGGCS